MAAEMERDAAGMESMVRTLTKFCECLHESGHLQQPFVVPRSKLESTVKRDGKRRLEDLSHRTPKALFFDAKEDKNTRMSVRDENGDIRHDIRKRSHYSVVEQPGGSPLGMFVPEESTGIGIALGLFEYLNHWGINLNEMFCVGGDNTSVNSGHTGGAFREFEMLLGRALQRALCLLHQVELPLRRLFIFYGGTTTAPGEFGGPLGKFIMSNELWKQPVRSYKKIGQDFPRLPEETLHKMSNDSQLMYKYCIAVETGEYDNFVMNKIGTCSTARWITFAARILRFYMSEMSYNSHVAECLERMVSFIVNVYYKVFANIKLKDTLIDAPVHLFDQIRFTREHCLPTEQKIIFESIQQNSYMAHPDSVILAMLGDKDRAVREKGVSIAQHVRRTEAYDRHIQTESGVRRPKRIRKYLRPKINFKCSTYSNMVKTKYQEVKGPGNPAKRIVFLIYNNNWEPVTNPPLITKLTAADLDKIREEPLVCDIPCHSQSVEHTVALVSHATQNRRTEDTQLMSILQISAAE